MRVVVDCAVLVAAARSTGVCREVLIEAVRRREIVLSTAIVDEYKAAAARQKHASYRNSLRAIVGVIEKVAVAVEPARFRLGLADPDDEAYPATAVAGGAFRLSETVGISRSRGTDQWRRCPCACASTAAAYRRMPGFSSSDLPG